MHARRLLTASALSLVLAVALTACGGSDGGSSSAPSADCKPAHPDLTTIADGKLTVSTYVSPPYTVLAKAGEEVSGIDGAIIRAIAAKECLSVEAKPVTGAAFIESITSKRGDLAIGGVYRTPEREKTLSVSTTMYRDGMAFVSKDGISTIAELTDKKVGVIQGYLWTKDMQKVLGNDHVTLYQDADSMLADLDAGRIDAATLTTAEGSFRAEQSGGLKSVVFPPRPHRGRSCWFSTRRRLL
jgi:polar amino acid transport system substrate-binding protein